MKYLFCKIAWGRDKPCFRSAWISVKSITHPAWTVNIGRAIFLSFNLFSGNVMTVLSGYVKPNGALIVDDKARGVVDRHLVAGA